MSLTFLIPAKNNPSGLTMKCVTAAANSCRMLNVKSDFVLIADLSDEQDEITQLFSEFRTSHSDLSVRIFRARKWLHYTGVFSLGLSTISEGDVFFLSNDMLITPYFLTAVFGVACLADKAGTIRGTSNCADGHPEYSILPPADVKTRDDLLRFSGSIYTANAMSYEPVRFFSGDAVLVKRALIDRIGVMDIGLFGYYGDVDYGIRAKLAGFDLVCAKGAWLYHLGGGHMVREMEKSGGSFHEHKAKRMNLVRDAFRVFRAKWNLPLPETFTGIPDFSEFISAGTQCDVRYDLPSEFWADIQEI